MFFSELSFVVEKYVKYFPFYGITELTKREKELSNSTSSSAKLSMRFRHILEGVLYFSRPAVMSMSKVIYFAP